jgi:hypothetical protein
VHGIGSYCWDRDVPSNWFLYITAVSSTALVIGKPVSVSTVNASSQVSRDGEGAVAVLVLLGR